MEIKEIFDFYKQNKLPPILTHEDLDETDRKEINTLFKSIIRRINTKEDKEFISEIIDKLQLLKQFTEYLEHPIYMNEFKDKYGNTYLQARTYVLNEDGKKKWKNSYIGTLKEFPDGIEDKKAIEKGKILLRAKLKSHYKIC
jgi:hypothetical protein